MSTDIKFCGLTRSEDAEHAVALGAAFVGVIFAGGPRLLSTDRATRVLRDVPASVRRVGVFADQTIDNIADTARALGLDVIQLHGGCNPERIAALRVVFTGEIWPVVRVSGSRLPAATTDLLLAADAVLLDAFVPGSLGGTGVTLPWATLATNLRELRDGGGSRRIILAGGLRPENVARAISDLTPDVVDVSSGVEVSPGIKDPDRMRAFRDAVAHAAVPS
ncbi:MAG TPA: phosphoribosylanthranilate isomerase [Gemmatimonadaceae bacterium]